MKKMSARTAKTRRLGQQDAANRCQWVNCRKPLGKGRVLAMDGRLYCSIDCRLEAHNAQMHEDVGEF